MSAYLRRPRPRRIGSSTMAQRDRTDRFRLAIPHQRERSPGRASMETPASRYPTSHAMDTQPSLQVAAPRAVQVTDQSTPVFIVHTHDDASSSVGAAKLYIAFKEHKVPAELHVYQNGGHGYGIRERPNSVISSWPARATDWLRVRGWIETPQPSASR